jgi:hypothetical protein
VLLPEAHPLAAVENFRQVERLVKFLLWARGGFRIHVKGPRELAGRMRDFYNESPTGKFDSRIIGEQIYGRPIEVEHADELPAERESWRAMGRTVKDGMRMVRVRPILLTILAISAVYGMAGEGFDRLWAPHLLENFTLPPLGQFEPVVWFGIIQAGGMLLTIGATEIARRKLDTDSHRSVVRVLITANALLIGAVVLFGLSSGFVIALLAFWLVSVLRTTIEPLYIAWLNQNVDSKVRATILSVNGLVNSIGEAGGGPIIGAIGTFSTLRVALTISGLILTPTLLLYNRTLRRDRSLEPEPAVIIGLEDEIVV